MRSTSPMLCALLSLTETLAAAAPVLLSVSPAAAPIEGGATLVATLSEALPAGSTNVSCNIKWRMDSWAVPSQSWPATVVDNTSEVHCKPMPSLPAEGPVDFFVSAVGVNASSKLNLATYATFSASMGMTPYYNSDSGLLLYKVNDTAGLIKAPYSISATTADGKHALLEDVTATGGDTKLALPISFAPLARRSGDWWLNLTLKTSQPSKSFELQVRLLRHSTQDGMLPSFAVAIDHTSRGLVVGGQPFFPMSWMTTMDSFGTDTMVETMTEMAQKGANSIMIYNLGDAGDTSGVHPNQESLYRVSRLMDAAQAYGLKVQMHIISMVEPLAQGINCQPEPFGPCSEKNNMTKLWTQLNAFVNKWKTHPALLSWYVADDGSWPGLDAVYTQLRVLDPFHPITMAIAGAGDAWRDTYLRGADVIQPENYPAKPSLAYDTVAVLSRFPFDWKPRITCAMGWAASPGISSVPSFRVQLYNAVVAGATGDIWFAHRSLPGEWNEPGPLFDESGALAKEMMQLVPSLLSSEVGASAQPRLSSFSAVSQSGQQALLHAVVRREASGCVHLFMANNRNEPVRASIKFASGTAGIYEEEGQLTHGVVPFEKAIPGSTDVRLVEVINGSLYEWMGAWTTQVFRFNGTSTCASPWHTDRSSKPAKNLELVSNGGFELSGSYIAEPVGWACGVGPRRAGGRRACFATAETSHSGRKSGRFSTAEDFGSFRVQVPIHAPKNGSDTVYFTAWVRTDRVQTVSLYSKVPAPSSATTAPSWPALVEEGLVASVEAGTNWTALVVPSLRLAPGMVLSLGISKAGVLWLDDVSALSP